MGLRESHDPEAAVNSGSPRISGRSAKTVMRTLAERLSGSRSRQRQDDLIVALNDVAAAVSSTISVDEVLETIVERAKQITNTEKAALVLTHEYTADLDRESTVVRGSRDEHSEDWWGAELQTVSAAVFRGSGTYLRLNQDNDAWLLCVPITVRDMPIGLLAAINSREHRFSAEQVDFLAILGAFASSAIENARLAEQSKYVLLASERDRIAREMHDGISQSLFSVALGMEVCRKEVLRNPQGVVKRLDELQEMVDLSRSELRRFIYDLRPVKLQELGLIGAIEYWLHEVTMGSEVASKIDVEGDVRTLTPAAEACLYQVAKESVSNIMKHANATSLQVTLVYADEDVSLRVSDDGQGFERQEASDRSRDGMSFGLRSIEQRVQREHGRFDLVTEVGRGTTIYVRLPV